MASGLGSGSLKPRPGPISQLHDGFGQAWPGFWWLGSGLAMAEVRLCRTLYKRNKYWLQPPNQCQHNSLPWETIKNLSHTSHKCIYMHIEQEFTTWSHILAHTGNMNIYGCLWTLTCICAGWTYFLILLYVFLSYYHPKAIITSPHHWHTHEGLLPSSQHHVWHQLPILSCFTPHSPVVCKDFSP